MTSLTLVNSITTDKCPKVQNTVQHREMESLNFQIWSTRMHSNRMHTAGSLPYRGSLSGRSLSRGLCPGGLYPGGSLSRGSVSRAVSVRETFVWGVSVQGGKGDPSPCENVTLPQTSFVGGNKKIRPIKFGSNTLTLRLKDNFLTCNLLCMSTRKILQC